jgi:cobaltochelatase CobT
MNNKISSLKEKMRQALTSTMKVISEDFKVKDQSSKNTNNFNSEITALDSLASPKDFIKLRAEFDSTALEKKFSNKIIFKNNLPKNSSCKYKV